MADEPAIHLPPGVTREGPRPDRGTIVNETSLPNSVVEEAVSTYIDEYASVLGVSGNSTFQMYAAEGSLLARSQYRPPANVIEEIVLARDLAERDDDVGNAMGAMTAVAFGEGMAHTHADEVIVKVFDKIAENANLDAVWHELYREWLISSQINTASVWTREDFQFQPAGADRNRTRNLVAPLIGVLPAEYIRIVGSDLFRTGTLALKPASGSQERWLEELFGESTSPGRQAELRRQDPVMAQLVVEQLPAIQDPFPSAFLSNLDDPAMGQRLYRLNPRLVHRSTMPKGAWAYPRPLLTRNFALLEAKRLLNIMDYALLQGGSNFLVIAKKGTDQKPAMREEVENLRDVIRRASRTGVIVGDHRLNIEIVTPDLKELLNPDKRKMIGRKLSDGLLRVPEEEDAGGEGEKARIELIQAVLTSDRRMLRRHVERNTYTEVVKRNSTVPTAAGIWFAKIILQGSQFFTDYVLKLRDRGDISRHTAVQVGGFDYEAEVRTRKLEKPDDVTMAPAAVPFSSPNAGPQDNPAGRTPGGTDPARPRQTVTRNAGETVTARFEEDHGAFRVGERTEAILLEYASSRVVGRITAFERAALDRIAGGEAVAFVEGPISVVPVNTEQDIAELRAVRLADGMSMIVGRRKTDGAVMARALCFRQPEYDPLAAQETALRWGFECDPISDDTALVPAAAGQGLELHIHGGDGKVTKKIVHRDDTGAITSIEEVEVDAD